MVNRFKLRNFPSSSCSYNSMLSNPFLERDLSLSDLSYDSSVGINLLYLKIRDSASSSPRCVYDTEIAYSTSSSINSSVSPHMRNLCRSAISSQPHSSSSFSTPPVDSLTIDERCRYAHIIADNLFDESVASPAASPAASPVASPAASPVASPAASSVAS